MKDFQLLLDTWSSRFSELRISKQLLSQAFSLKPDAAEIAPLYQLCKKIRNLSPSYQFETSWELCLLSQDVQWVTNQLPYLTETIVTGNDSLTPLHFAAESGSFECFMTVLNAFPKLKFARLMNGWTVAHTAALFSESQVVFQIFEIIPELLTEKDSIFRSAILAKNLECTIAFIRTYKELTNEILQNELGNLLILLTKNSTSETISQFASKMVTLQLDGTPVAHFFAGKGLTAPLLAMLAADRSLVEARDHQGATVAHFAALYNRDETLKTLVQRYPISLSTLDYSNNTIAHYNAYVGALNFKDADFFKIKNCYGMTALDIAGYSGNTRALLDNYNYFDTCVSILYARLTTISCKLKIAKSKLPMQIDLDPLNDAIEILKYSKSKMPLTLFSEIADFIGTLLQQCHQMIDAQIVCWLARQERAMVPVVGAYLARTLIECRTPPATGSIAKAILNALEYMLDDHGHLILLKEDDQRLFDNYLKLAVNEHDRSQLQTVLSDDERCDLMLSLIINELKESHACDELILQVRKMQIEKTVGNLRKLPDTYADDYDQSFMLALKYANQLARRAELLKKLSNPHEVSLNVSFKTRAENFLLLFIYPIDQSSVKFDVLLQRTLGINRGIACNQLSILHRSMLLKLLILNYLEMPAPTLTMLDELNNENIHAINKAWGQYKFDSSNECVLKCIYACDTMTNEFDCHFFIKKALLSLEPKNKFDYEKVLTGIGILKQAKRNEIDDAVKDLKRYYDQAVFAEVERFQQYPSHQQNKRFILNLINTTTSHPEIENKLNLVFAINIPTLLSSATNSDHFFLTTLQQAFYDKNIIELVYVYNLNRKKWLTIAMDTHNKSWLRAYHKVFMLALAYNDSDRQQEILEKAEPLWVDVYLNKEAYSQPLEVLLEVEKGTNQFLTESAVWLSKNNQIHLSDRISFLRVMLNEQSCSENQKIQLNACIHKLAQLTEQVPDINSTLNLLELSDAAKLQIDLLAQFEMQKIAETTNELVNVTDWLLTLSYEHKNDEDLEVRAILSKAQSALLYYIIAPKLMHDSIQTIYQEATARVILLDRIQKPYSAVPINYQHAPSCEFFSPPENSEPKPYLQTADEVLSDCINMLFY